VTAAGTTTLTASATHYQHFSGTTTQTLKLPDETTIPTATGYIVDNDSSGNVTVQDSAGNTLATAIPGGAGWIYSLSNGSATGNWAGYLLPPGNSATAPLTWGTAGLNMSGQYLQGVTTLNMTGQLTNTVATGTAPFVVSSTTQVANLNAATAGSVTNALTLNNGGSGAASGTTYNGSSAVTLSYNTLGASPVAGSSSIVTLGVVTTGTWNANTITVGYGGTGVTTTPTNGQLLIGNGTNYTVASLGTSTGISTTTGSGTLTINNTGVTSNVAGTGISVSGATGAVTITNSGVTSAVAGTGVSVSGSTGAVTFSIGQSVATSASPTFSSINLTTATVTPNTSGVSTGLNVVNGDITTYRSGGTSGVIFFGSSGGRYLYYDGTNYNMPGGQLLVNSNTVLNAGNYTSYSPSLTGTGASGTWGINITGNSGNTSSVSNATGGTYTWTGDNYFLSNMNTGGGSSPPLMAYSTGGNGAIMAFHRGGYYAVNMGLDSDNVLRIGGWSAPYNLFQMDMSGNLTMGGSTTTNGWFYVNGGYGLYWNSYGRGIQAADAAFSYGNIGTYGGGLNGWRGYGVYPNNFILMANGSTGGVYNPASGLWIWQSDMSGNVTWNGNVTAYSDIRLKENIRPIENITVRRDNLAKSAIQYERDGRTRVGYAAQWLQEDNPEFVLEAEDSLKIVTGLGTLSVDYGETAAVLAAASKMTDDRVAALEARVAQLEKLLEEKFK
jgi:hypothetical protein